MILKLFDLKILFVILAASSFLAGGLNLKLGSHTPNWELLGFFFLITGLFLV